MALSADIVWEVRSTATAGNLNGGGFKAGASGTDKSQSDSAAYNFTDLAGTNANGATPDVTSASHTFDSTDVGNIIHITAGTNWTAGWYEILSVNAGAARLDRACASVASPTNGTYYVGGALSLQNSSGATDSLFMAATAAGNTIWVKAGTYNMPAAYTAGTNGTATAMTKLTGYTTTRGDGAPTRPLLTSTVGTTQYLHGNFWIISNIEFVAAGSTAVNSGSSSKVFNCKITNNSTSANRFGLTGQTGAHIENCEIVCYRGVGYRGTTTFFSMVGCYVHDCDIGIDSTATSAATPILVNNIIAGCVTKAINLGAITAACLIYNNTIFGSENKLGIGVFIASGGTNVHLVNNIIYGFATGVSHADSGQKAGFDSHNTYYNNTADVSNWTIGSTSLTVDPKFRLVGEKSGATATTSGSVLTQSGADFSTVVDNQDYCYIVSGTGITAGIYLITGHTTTTLTLDIAPGTSATADKVFRVVTGRDWRVGLPVRNKAYPGTFPAGLTIGKMNIGAVQSMPGMPKRVG